MKVSLLVAGILVFTFGWSAQASFTLQVDSVGTPILPWADSTIVFDVNYSACPASVSSQQLDGAIDAALEVWNSTSMTSLKLKRGDQVTTTVPQAKLMTGTQRPLIACDADMGVDLGGAGPPIETQNIPAVAQLLRLDGRGHIAGAVIYLNAEISKAANIGNVFALYPGLLPIILAHEIGHVLGLGHDSDANALMYYDASAKKELGLSSSDVKGVVYLYPRQEIGGSVPFLGCGAIQRVPMGGDGPHPSSASTAAAAEFAMLLLFCAAVRRGIPSFHYEKILYRERV